MINKVILVGRFGQDAVVKYSPQGMGVAKVSLATGEKWTAKDGTEQSRTVWHNLVMFDKLAEIAGKYFTKGSMAYVEGKISIRDYEKDGVKKTVHEIIASTIRLVGDRRSSEGSTHQET